MTKAEKKMRFNQWLRVIVLLFTLSPFHSFTFTFAQDTYNQIDEYGNVTQRTDNKNFNKHNNDTTRNKEVPKGLHAWTIDRTFGDRTPAVPDTLPHLFMNTTLLAATTQPARAVSSSTGPLPRSTSSPSLTVS